MFVHIKLLKKFHLSKTPAIYLKSRNITIIKYLLTEKKILITNSLTWVRYNNTSYHEKLKYGSFAFTRKPFAKPAKRISKKKR